jgi:hypothetical protein
VSRASCRRVFTTTLAVGLGFLLAPVAHAQLQRKDFQVQQQPPQQKPQAQQPQQQQQQQQQPPDLEQLWQMQKQQMRARIFGAIKQLRTACADDLRKFCGTVTPGEGRLLLCMQAHEDKISRPCELAVLETTRNVGNAVRRLENLAQNCWEDIQAHCVGGRGSVLQCMVEKRASLSPPCQAIVAATLPSAQSSQLPSGQTTMIGLPVYSADGVMLGQVRGLKRRSDGSLEAVEAELGRPMGLGAVSVLINPSDLRLRGDGVELQMIADQVRSVLQGQRR